MRDAKIAERTLEVAAAARRSRPGKESMGHSTQDGRTSCKGCSCTRQQWRQELEATLRAHPPSCAHPHPIGLRSSTVRPRPRARRMATTATSSNCLRSAPACRTSTASEASAPAQPAARSARGFLCGDGQGTGRRGWPPSEGSRATGSGGGATCRWSDLLGSSRAADVAARRRGSRWKIASTCSARA